MSIDASELAERVVPPLEEPDPSSEPQMPPYGLACVALTWLSILVAILAPLVILALGIKSVFGIGPVIAMIGLGMIELGRLARVGRVILAGMVQLALVITVSLVILWSGRALAEAQGPIFWISVLYALGALALVGMGLWQWWIWRNWTESQDGTAAPTSTPTP